MSFDFSTLITDRAQSDLSALKTLLAKPVDQWTDEEKAQFATAVSKGAYNYTDLNRVTEAMAYLDEVLRGYGYETGFVPIKIQREDDGDNTTSVDSNTMLLIEEGSIGDVSPHNVTITNEGVQLSNEKSKFGGPSLYFNGSAKLLIPQATIIFGQGPFTIDWWEYAEQGAAARFVSAYSPEDVYGGIQIGYNGTYLTMSDNMDNQWDLNTNSAFSVTPNAWVHWAIVRDGNAIKVYRNGVNTYSGNFIGSIASPTEYSMAIGSDRQDQPSGSNFIGYISEFRISNVARWTSNFSPPQRPYSAEGYENVTPSMTSDNTPDGYLASASSVHTADRAAWCAFNSNENPWHSSSGLPQWVQLQYPNPVVVNAITIQNPPADTYGTMGITTFILQGSNNGSDFENLYTGNNDPTNSQINWFSINNNTAYLIYRIQVTETGYYHSNLPYCVITSAVFYRDPNQTSPDPECPLDPYTWYETDTPTLSQMTQYLSNVLTVVSVFIDEPQLPHQMASLTVENANKIEFALLELWRLVEILPRSFVPCGEAICGGDNL